MRARAAAVLAFAFALGGVTGCKSGPGAKSPSGGGATSASCDRLASNLTAFGEVLEIASADAKVRVSSYAGVLELLLSFEAASTELDGSLGQIADKDLDEGLKKTRASLARSIQFAQSSRAAMEQHAKEIAPLAKETQQAWSALRSACDKGKTADCSGVRDAIAKFDVAETNEGHDKAIAALASLKVSTPALLKARDRATNASKAVQVAIKARAETTTEMPKKWMEVQKDLSSTVDTLMESCHADARSIANTQQLVVSAHPDPRKLTVLVHVKPPPSVEKQLLGLAASSTDADERAFYKSRAEGAFGSGFFLVRKGEKGGTEVLVVTNRHVVELGDKAVLELADGTSLGNAEIVYSNPAHDLAVLRPSGKLGITEGFAFADQPAKDQQTVIATGFPGMIGRPSYQTTKGYVSNESFKLEEGARPLTYVQHTAPIDPGSSGGPLTDESGKVLGVNTLKVTGREGVGLAVPSKYVLSTLQTAEGIDSHHANAPARAKDARLACLGFIAEMGLPEPRLLVLEQMISNHLVSTDGLESAAALSGESGFEELWNDDSVRAMRIASLVRVRALIAAGGGPSVLETCDDPDTAGAKPDLVKYKIRLANFESRDLVLRWEHGRWKIDGVSGGGGPKAASQKKLPSGSGGGGKKITPPKKRP